MSDMRWLSLIPLAAVVAVLATGCGGGQERAAAPPGSPDNPLQGQTQGAAPGAVSRTGSSNAAGRSNEAAAAPEAEQGAEAKPGYQALVDKQSKHPRSRFTPCNLVTRSQAGAILGESIRPPLEAPQGPTCIYRSASGRSFITLAVQSVAFRTLQRQIRRPHTVAIGGRRAVCGTYGKPMLYVPLSGGRVLSVAAQCDTAKQFAARAVRRLGS